MSAQLLCATWSFGSYVITLATGNWQNVLSRSCLLEWKKCWNFGNINLRIRRQNTWEWWNFSCRRWFHKMVMRNLTPSQLLNSFGTVSLNTILTRYWWHVWVLVKNSLKVYSPFMQQVWLMVNKNSNNVNDIFAARHCERRRSTHYSPNSQSANWQCRKLHFSRDYFFLIHRWNVKNLDVERLYLINSPFTQPFECGNWGF